jgi:Protein of unknown function (DUF2934)
MARADAPSAFFTLTSGLTAEKRVATDLWNQNERQRLIAKKAYEAFYSRGYEHGLDVEDWLTAEHALSAAADDFTINETDKGFDISLGTRPEKRHLILHIAPSSVLALWTAHHTDAAEQNGEFQTSGLSVAVLPENIDPAGAEVGYRDDRVSIHLPYAVDGQTPSETSDVEANKQRALVTSEH